MNAILKFSTVADSLSDLVLRAQADDMQAFGELYERFLPVVRAIALRRLRDAEDADEVAQDVFVKVLRKLHQLRDAAAFPGWIKSIAVRMSINYAQRRRVQMPMSSADVSWIEDESQDPLGAVAGWESRDQVHERLQRLRELDRATLLAFYVEGKSLAQMADEFAAPLGTIKRRLHVARHRLADEMRELVSA